MQFIVFWWQVQPDGIQQSGFIENWLWIEMNIYRTRWFSAGSQIEREHDYNSNHRIFLGGTRQFHGDPPRADSLSLWPFNVTVNQRKLS